MNISTEAKLEAFKRLLQIMDDLRSQCPWYKKQTIHSLRNLTIEETYELAESITGNDWQGIKEELGDVLLHMIFYSKIGEEQEQFSIADVLNAQCEKLIHREQLKLKEGKKSVLQGVPSGLPAMIKAYRIQEKAAQVKFEWENKEQVWSKVEEEMQELKEVINTPGYDQQKLEAEFGDLMFSMINLSRFIHVDPENALERTNKKFISRFQYIEAQATKQNKQLINMTLEEMDNLWNEAKKSEV